MKPYYTDQFVTLYHGDCREVLPTLGSFDLVLTDPPWITGDKKCKRAGRGVAEDVRGSNHLKYGEIGFFDPLLIGELFAMHGGDTFVICGFKELGQVIGAMAPIRGCFIWNKPNGAVTHAYPTPLDLAYIVWGCKGASKIVGFQHWKSGVFRYAVPSAGCISNGERILVEENGPTAHPCQGPVNLYMDLIKPAAFQTILDPFAGSGTTGRAAKDLGRKAVLIEKEEAYCEIAANRLSQEVMQLT